MYFSRTGLTVVCCQTENQRWAVACPLVGGLCGGHLSLTIGSAPDAGKLQPEIAVPQPEPEPAPAAAQAEERQEEDAEVPAILRKRRVAAGG
jgi:hypothetical protein